MCGPFAQHRVTPSVACDRLETHAPPPTNSGRDQGPGARALPAVAKAARIARACGAEVHLFHAIKASVWADSPAAYEAALLDLDETQRQQGLQRLDRIAARLRLHGVKVSTTVEYDYPVYDAIVRRARLIDADLIVASRRKKHRTLPGLLRLTDWELLRNSPVPVLLVKRSGPYRHPRVLAAVDPCHAHAKPAQLDAEILSVGAQLTKALRGKLHAVHAYAPVVIDGAAANLDPRIATRLDGLAATQARAQFERLLERVDIPPARRHLVGASPRWLSTTSRGRRARASSSWAHCRAPGSNAC